MVAGEAGFFEGFEEPGFGGEVGEVGGQGFLGEEFGVGFAADGLEPGGEVEGCGGGGLVDLDLVENNDIGAFSMVHLGEDAGDVGGFDPEVLGGVFFGLVFGVVRDAVEVEEVLDIVGDGGEFAGENWTG